MNNKLLTIQQTLKVNKNQYNSFGGYSYRSCEDILEAVKPILKELELTLKLEDELVYVGERYYVKATATLSDGKEYITNTAYAREEETRKGMGADQLTGATSSYARKYALNGLFAIDDMKDSDTTNTGEDKPKTNTTATDKQLEILKKNYTGENLKKLLELNKIEKLEDMPMKKASEIISKLMANKESK